MTTAVWLTLTKRCCLWSSDVTRADTVALDVVSAILRADVASKHLQTTLSGCISRNGLTTQLRHHGADIDDLTLATLHHLGDDSRRNDERSYQVNVDNLLELATLHLVHRDTLDDTSVVYQNINLTNLSVNLLHECLHGHFVSHVTNIALHILDASLFVVVQTTLQSSLVDVVENNVLNTCCNKSLSNVEANSVGCASDPGVFSFQ